MRCIVVGFDGSDQAFDALRLGTQLVRTTGARLGVAMIDEADGQIPVPSAYDAAHESRLADAFDPAAAFLERVPFERYTFIGSVPHGLEAIADDAGADMIVVGSTHRSEFGQTLPGSVASRLMSGAGCAIGIAPRGYARSAGDGFGKIGVGYDGEDEAKRALELAAQLASSVGLLRLIAVAPVDKPEPGRISHTAPDYARRVQRLLKERLEQGEQSLDGSVAREVCLEVGDPAAVLTEASRHLDLLVLGSRGYGPIRRVMLGHTAMSVIGSASCPVIVVPRSSAEAELGEPGVRRLEAIAS